MERGLSHTSTMRVTAEVTAEYIGSGDLAVLATPAMCALMENKGDDENGVPILEINFVDVPFLESNVSCTENSYEATVSFPKEKILSGDGEIYFNAYRLETDGGEMDKHLFALNPTMKPKFHRPSHFLWLKDYLK